MLGASKSFLNTSTYNYDEYLHVYWTDAYTINTISKAIDGNFREITLFSTWYWKFTITLRESEEFLLPSSFYITYTIINKYYQGELVNTNIQSLINILQEKIG